VVRLLDAGGRLCGEAGAERSAQGTVRALVRRGSTVRTTETLVVGSLVLNRVTHRVFDPRASSPYPPSSVSSSTSCCTPETWSVARSCWRSLDMNSIPAQCVDANRAAGRKIDGTPRPVISTVRGGFKLERER